MLTKQCTASGDGGVLADVAGRFFDPVASGAYTESAAAEVLAEWVHAREAVRYDAQRDAWLVWGTDKAGQPVWSLVPTSPIDYARSLALAASKQMVKGDTLTDEGKARLRLKTRFSTSAGVGALAKLLLDVARRESSVLYTRADLIDADDRPWQLWAGGHLYDLRDAWDGGRDAFKPLPVSSRDTVHLVTAACEPDPTRETPFWDLLLDALVGEDADGSDPIRAYLLAVLGACVTGVSDRLMALPWGPSGKGKSYLAKVMLAVLGSYGHTAPASLLGEHSDKAQEAALEGKRLVFVDEGPRVGKLATERLKALTGGTPQTTRALFMKPTTWLPRLTLFMSSNELPPLADPAVRARLRPIDFTDADADEVRRVAQMIGEPSESVTLRAEMPGILAKLMREAGRYLADRSVADVPASVNEALDDIETDQNPVKSWLEDRTTAGEARSIDLYNDFFTWCTRMGTRNPWSLAKWGQVMTDLGYPVRKTRASKVRPLALKGYAITWGSVDTPTSKVSTGGHLEPGNDASVAALSLQPPATPVRVDTTVSTGGHLNRHGVHAHSALSCAGFSRSVDTVDTSSPTGLEIGRSRYMGEQGVSGVHGVHGVHAGGAA